mmetsp:Transcript_9421/g.20024  ORF Transcript_9421/g.20024 Transcript_9421/m.20024 type:complete len:260 (-) Transcript_9421:285-1064(-)
MKLSIAIILSALLTTSSAFAPASPGTAGRSSARSHAALMSSLADAPAPAENASDSDAAAEAAEEAAAPTDDASAMTEASGGGDVDIASGDRQKLYGQDLDLPETYVMCGRCKTAYAMQPDDLGTRGKGRRIECSVCHHSWYQARDRLFTINEAHELVPAPSHHLERVSSNLAADRPPAYCGELKVYVGNLDFYTSEEDLRNVFAEKGEVGDVNIITDDDGRSRGFAFVSMMNKEDEAKVLELDGQDVSGRSIVVRPPNN